MRRADNLRGLIARPDFRRLYFVRIASQGADGVFQASLAGAVLFNPERQSNPVQVAAGFAVLLLPYSFVGPFAGVLLDRWSRQRVLTITNMARFVLVALVAIEIAAGLGGLALYGGALLIISTSRFFLAALSASLPHVVTTRQLLTANSVSTTSGAIATVVGGGIAIVIRDIIGASNHGYATVAVCSGLGYLISAFVARGFPYAILGPDVAEKAQRETARDVVQGMVAGGLHVWHRPKALYALSAFCVHRFFYGFATIATLLLYRNFFHTEGFFRAGLTGLGQVLTFGAVGTFLAAVTTPAATNRLAKSSWITSMLVLAMVTQLALYAPFHMQTILPAALLLGFVSQGTKICVDTIVQETIDDEFRGRVFSFYDTMFNVMFVAATTVGAFTLPTSGKSYTAVIVIAIGYGITAAIYYIGVGRLNHTPETQPESDPIAPR